MEVSVSSYRATPSHHPFPTINIFPERNHPAIGYPHGERVSPSGRLLLFAVRSRRIFDKTWALRWHPSAKTMRRCALEMWLDASGCKLNLSESKTSNVVGNEYFGHSSNHEMMNLDFSQSETKTDLLKSHTINLNLSNVFQSQFIEADLIEVKPSWSNTICLSRRPSDTRETRHQETQKRGVCPADSGRGSPNPQKRRWTIQSGWLQVSPW